jgi:DNA-3-methyladenine glycosylase
MNIINSSFYTRDTIEVAQDLLGKMLVRHYNGLYLTGIIAETEAYRFCDDHASHAYRGKTERNSAMFGSVGCVYVYFIYGVHFCLKVVARHEKLQAGAVLIRSIVPIQGISFMQEARKKTTDLTTGPGKLTQALYITREQNGVETKA